MATKIYIGNNEIAGGGSGGGASYDSEMEVISNALVDLKAIINNLTKLANKTEESLNSYKSSNDDAINDINETLILLDSYNKEETNVQLKVIAAALSHLDDRLKNIESSIQS